MKSLFWLKTPLTPLKNKQVNTQMKEAHRRAWEINKMLSRLLRTTSLVGVVFMCVRIGGCENRSVQYFTTKAMKRYWVGNVGQCCLVLHHMNSRLHHQPK